VFLAMRRLQTNMAFIVAIIGFCLILTSTPKSAFAQKTPQILVQDLIEATHAQDEGRVRALWQPGPWSKKTDNPGYGLYHQSVRKRFTLLARGVQTKKDRALATVDIERNGRIVDRVYFYAMHTQSRWIFVDADESKAHVRHFLAGTVPGRFSVRYLPPNPALEGVGKALIKLAHGEAKSPKGPQIINAPDAISPVLRRWARTTKLRVTKTLYFAPMKRGAIEFTTKTEIVNAQGKTVQFDDHWIVYVEQKPDHRWRITNDGSYLSVDSFLE